MPRKRLVIHVGFHKSGTTALQESLFVQRQDLLKEGVSFPNFGQKAHHRLAWALTGKAWGWKKRGGVATPLNVWSKATKRIKSSGARTVFLSSEFFSELTTEKIQKVKNDLKSRDVEVLFTIRPLAKLLGSSYQQYLKYGTKADYETWLHSVLDEPGVSKINPTFWLRHMHGDVITKWADVFGADKVSVIIVDESRPTFLFHSVNQLLGLDGLLKPQQTGKNRSLSVEELSLLLEINKLYPVDREWNEYLIFIRNGLVREITDNLPVKAVQVRMPTPQWAVSKANSLATDSKEKILNLGVKVYGDIQSLDSTVIPTGTQTYSQTIDIETVARVLLTYNRSLIRRFPARWILADLKRRIVRIVKRRISR